MSTIHRIGRVALVVFSPVLVVAAAAGIGVMLILYAAAAFMLAPCEAIMEAWKGESA